MGRPRKTQPSGEARFLDEMDGGGGEDSWVIVKKQRVTILIPPQPDDPENNTVLPTPASEDMEEEAIPMEETRSISCSIGAQEQVDAACSDVQIVVDNPPDRTCSMEEQEELDAALLAPSSDVEMVTETRARSCSVGEAEKVDAALATNEERPVSTIQRRTCLEETNVDRGEARDTVGVSRPSKIIKRPRMLPGLRSLLDGRLQLDQTLRAKLIERKLEKAGGLSNWLGSIGLDQFVRIFDNRSVGKFQLVNLTMNKLKDMGVDAVGPRRKLMHAIDCICQPYCFESK